MPPWILPLILSFWEGDWVSVQSGFHFISAVCFVQLLGFSALSKFLVICRGFAQCHSSQGCKVWLDLDWQETPSFLLDKTWNLFPGGPGTPSFRSFFEMWGCVGSVNLRERGACEESIWIRRWGASKLYSPRETGASQGQSRWWRGINLGQGPWRQWPGAALLDSGSPRMLGIFCHELPVAHGHAH